MNDQIVFEVHPCVTEQVDEEREPAEIEADEQYEEGPKGA